MKVEITPQLFRGAAELLENTGWTQQVYAHDSISDEEIPVWHENASCFCLLGALARVAGAVSKTEVDAVAMRVAPVFSKYLGVTRPARWNDMPNRTADEVINTLNEIADKLEKESK